MSEIPGKCAQARSIILMILNNLDDEVAQFPQELVIYGGNGQIFSNWIQFRLVLYYLSIMDEEQTLALYSGHPMGLFPSHPNAPRVVITNGMMIPNYSTKELYDKFFAMGVTQFGQMTAGSYSYIGPQGIVHGTTITLMNAGRKYLGLENLSGKIFVTSGLGGMSGAQAKAAHIAGCVGVIAESNFSIPILKCCSKFHVCETALRKRHAQGWLDVFSDNLDEVIKLIKQNRDTKHGISIGYLGNVVDLWERLVEEEDLSIELGSDQTSLHNPFNGGYYPVGISFDEANKMMVDDPVQFKQLVQKSLLRQIAAIDALAKRGLHFWDYGNAFLVECARAGADVLQPNAIDDKAFKYPSYIQEFMGRDHHDVSGTDSPFRETANIVDGSAFTADMAIQNVIGDSFRGATWVSIHNGGGTGWGDAMNGGFGMLLDGSKEAAHRAEMMLNWDVSNGVARRCWSGNDFAHETIKRTMQQVPGLVITLPNQVDSKHLEDVL
ncbi:unnamed protein product [Anisakis simplex]|uniref:Uncharacterized protein n=1 Tax=Anisakis simplex TaxID=6269 RepID=A0A3P6QBA1_ANISI|nr:unnamed protein product [Anisakis simplex]